MNLLTNRIVRVPIVAVSFAAWLAISNHCALAAFDGAAKLPTASCHDTKPANHSPAKQNPESGVECCKVLRATLLTLSKSIAACDALTFAAHEYVTGLIPIRDESQLRRVFEWDTGPPGADSFAESVLQRSILAHAPPVLA
ncbi:MAG: hypothetical protein ABI871_00625 [Chthoniobacterales bacterium]